MAIKQVKFKDSGKVIDIKIDNCGESISVKTIEKEDITITINQLNDTALNEDIIIDATITPVDKGVMTISLWSMDRTKKYYSSNVSFNDGHLYYNLFNGLKVGQYIVTLEYAGNKYYNSKEVSKQINIKRREILCDFESRMIYAYPDETIDIDFKIVDKINNQPIRNCQFSYVYKDETFNINSDNNGNVRLQITTPDTDKDHCKTNTISYLIWFYLKDSDSYLMKDNSINLIIKKINTQISAKNIKKEDEQYIKGDVIRDSGYVNYGKVSVSFLNGTPAKIDIEENGAFEYKIDIKDVMNRLTSDSDGVFNASEIIYTKLTISPISVNVKLSESQEIQVNASVVDEKGNPVIDGAVDFKMYDSNKKLVYRYVDELDDGGQVLFTFYPSKVGEYTIEASYSSEVTYKESKSQEDIIIKVEE